MNDINLLTFIVLKNLVQLIHPGKKVIRLRSFKAGKKVPKVFFGLQLLSLTGWDPEIKYTVNSGLDTLNQTINKLITFTMRIQCFGHNAISYLQHIDTVCETDTIMEFFHNNNMTINQVMTIQELTQLIDSNMEERGFMDLMCSIVVTNEVLDVYQGVTIEVDGTIKNTVNDKTITINAEVI